MRERERERESDRDRVIKIEREKSVCICDAEVGCCQLAYNMKCGARAKSITGNKII